VTDDASTTDGGGTARPDPEAGRSDDRRFVESLTDRLPGGDVGLVVGLLAAVYLAYVLIGVVLGYGLRGQLNSIATLTFYVAVFSMLALALNLHWGYTGLFNIGVVGFMGVGIYVTAIVSKPVYTGSGAAQVGGLGLPLPVGVLAGVIAAGLFGLLVGLPALRLRADYLAITTIAMSEIARFSFLSSELQRFTLLDLVPFVSTDLGIEVLTAPVGFGGGSGLILDYTDPLQYLFETLGLWDAYLGAVGAAEAIVPTNPKPVVDGLVYAALLLCVVAGFYWLLRRTGESPFGRVLKAIREDEAVTNALGKNTNRFKLTSFVLGCALMGLAGILWLVGQGAVTPNFFRPRITFFVWVALIIGGAGSNTGSVVGGAIFAAVLYQGPLYLQNVVETTLGGVGRAPSGFGPAVAPLVSSADPTPLFLYTLDSVQQLQLVAMGVVLIWLMQNRPEGLLGHRKEMAASIPLAPPARTARDPDPDPAAAEPDPESRTDGGGDRDV
jgi:branched-chain amino acid transport system permease protein